MADRKIFANQGPTKPDTPKSTFDLSHANNGTYRFGRIYPIFCYESPAGSSFRIKPYAGFDMQPLAFPIQTNVRCHMSFYKIPLRILWKHYRDFVGQHASDGSIATAATQYKIPYISRSDDWYKTGSLADYMGLPTEVMKSEVVWQDFLRSHYFETQYNVCPREFTVHFPRNFTTPTVFDSKYSSNASAGVGTAFVVPYIKDYTPNSSNTINVDLIHDTNATLPTTIKCGMYTCINYPASNDDASRRYRMYAIEVDKSCNIAPVTSGGSPISTDLGNGKSITRMAITLHADIRGALHQYSPIYSCLWFQWRNASNGNVNDQYGRALHDPIDRLHVASQSISTFEKNDDEIVPHVYNQPNGFKAFVSIQIEHTTSDGSNMFKAISGTNDGKPYIPISALPFRAYEFIYNYFFRNERVTPFQKGGHDVFNEFLTNDGDGPDSSTPITFKNAPYEYDLFTTCVKSPQFGNAPLVGITTNDDTATFHMGKVSVTGDYSGNYNINVDTNAGKIVQITNYDEVANNPAVVRLQEAIKYGISINDFRNVNALQRFQERYMKAGTKYQNIVYEFFGTNPPIGEEFPEYIGGVTSNINVSKVVSTADTGDKGLGGYVGQGSFASKGGTIRCFCAEQSYIMGVMYFTVTPTYSQMLPRHFSKTQLLDFYNPQFANIGLQPVYRHQIAPLQLSTSEVGEVFGYNRPFSEYVSMQDEVHGDFRTNMANYLLQRVFGSKPQLSEDFLYIKSDDLTEVFCDTSDDDKIFGQIYFDIKAKLPIPRFAVPRII